ATSATRSVEKPNLRWLGALLAGAFLLAFLAWPLLRRTPPPGPAGSAARIARDTAQSSAQAARDAAQRAGQATGDAVQTGRDALAALGPLTTRRLPGDVNLNVPERGVESSMIVFLNDTSKPVDPSVWFNFDRLQFDTGSATLRPESQEQLKNIAAI